MGALVRYGVKHPPNTGSSRGDILLVGDSQKQGFLVESSFRVLLLFLHLVTVYIEHIGFVPVCFSLPLVCVRVW